jgi:hypothetical protein
MKNKILSILGVVTVVTTLLAIVGVTPVSAATQAWSSIAAPATSAGTTYVGPMAKAVDGTLYTASAWDDGDMDGDGGIFIYKSTDFGRTWTQTASQPSESSANGMKANSNVFSDPLATQTNVITDIQCPGTDGNTVYVTDGYDIFKSVNGGTTWAAEVNLNDNIAGSTSSSKFIVSISIGTYNGTVEVFAAVTSFGAGTGGAYVLNETVSNNPWANLNVGTQRPLPFSSLDVTKVLVDPAFGTTQMVMAVISDYTDNVTRVSTKYGVLQWDTTANDVVLQYGVNGTPTGGAPVLLTSDIYLPTDFSSTVTSNNMNLFVSTCTMPGAATESGVNGFSDVFQAYFGPAAIANTPAYDMDVAGANTAFNVTGMDGVGAFATANIMVSGYTNTTSGLPSAKPMVFTTKNGGISWSAAAKNPTGGVSPLTTVFGASTRWVPLSSVIVKSDFATSGIAVVGTQGVDCGVSITTDFGNTFNTISLISTSVSGVTKISLATDGTIYETSYSVGSGAAATANGVVAPTSIGSITLVTGGTYTAGTPTVTIGAPNIAGGTQATAHAVMNGGNTAVASFVIDNPGSGYLFAPSVTVTAGTSTGTVQATGTAVLATAAGTVTGLTLTSRGVQYLIAPTVTINRGTGDTTGAGATATATIDSFGHVTGVTLTNPGTGYTVTPTVSFSSAVSDRRYSAWRYSPTAAAWDRINSYSLYAVPFAFNMIATTPDQAAVFISDNVNNQLYRSTDKGQTWARWGAQVPTTSGIINSWLVISPTTVLIGASTGGVIFSTTNGAVWLTRQAFANTTVAVTDIRVAGNGDYLAAGRDSAGDINVTKSTTAGVSWISNDHSGLTVTSTAYIGAAADYATSGIVYYTGDGSGVGVYYSTILAAPASVPTANRADNSANFFQQSGASGLITSPGGPGIAAEGTGMAYATNALGLTRIKGRVATTAVTAAGELIPNPISNNSPVALTGLYVSTNSVGTVTLWAVGADRKIYTYTDTLNVAVAGVTASNVYTAFTGVNPSSATISWTATANASNYVVVLSVNAQPSNLYDALQNNPGIVAFTTNPSYTFSQVLAPNTGYFVTVWAIKWTNATVGLTAISQLTTMPSTSFISSFGGALSFTTPLQYPTTPMELVPALGASNVSVTGTPFAWMTVQGATSYTLQITTASDVGFASPVFNSATVPAVTGPTTTFNYTGTLLNNTSYIWRVKANGTTGSDWVYGNFTTIPVVTPPVTVTNVPAATIVLPTAPPAVTITVQPAVTPVLTVTQNLYTLVPAEQTTPAYIWIIVGVGALLTLAVIILIIRTRRVV